jgi:hypothetical protein
MLIPKMYINIPLWHNAPKKLKLGPLFFLFSKFDLNFSGTFGQFKKLISPLETEISQFFEPIFGVNLLNIVKSLKSFPNTKIHGARSSLKTIVSYSPLQQPEMMYCRLDVFYQFEARVPEFEAVYSVQSTEAIFTNSLRKKFANCTDV